MSGGSFWTWFDVNHFTFHEYMHEKQPYIFVPRDLDVRPVDLKFAPPVTSV